MKNEDVIQRLGTITLPNIIPTDHRSELRASLLEQYPLFRTKDEPKGMFGRLWSYLTRSKLRILVVSASVVIIIVLVVSLQFTGAFSGISGVLDKASAAMERVDSYRVIADAHNRSEYTNNELVEISYHEAEYTSTNRYRFVLKYSSIDTEMIVIDNQIYIRGDTVTPQTPEQVIENLPSKQQTLDQLDTLADIRALEEEYIDGVMCYHYQGYLDKEKYLEKMLPVMEEYFTELYKPLADLLDEQYKDETEKPVLTSLEDSVREGLESYEEYIRKYETVIDYWIGEEDYLIRKEESVRRPVSDPLEVHEEMITVARYYDFNEDIIINPPLTETGELKEGWYELEMGYFDSLR